MVASRALFVSRLLDIFALLSVIKSNAQCNGLQSGMCYDYTCTHKALHVLYHTKALAHTHTHRVLKLLTHRDATLYLATKSLTAKTELSE